MYGNYDTREYGRSNENVIKEYAVANLIRIVNTQEIWQTIPKNDKKNIILCLVAYARGSVTRIMEEPLVNDTWRDKTINSFMENISLSRK